MWADARSAVPLRVDVVAVGAAVPAMTSQFTDFSTAVPARSVTAFAPPASARVRDRAVPDLVAFISRFGGVVPPVTLVGLPRNDRLRPYGAVGVYGRGLTEVVAVPLPGGQARELRRRLATAPGVSDHPGRRGPDRRPARPAADHGGPDRRRVAAHRHGHAADPDRGGDRAAPYLG